MKQITRKYHLFDAKDEVLGRLATKVAQILIGKHHPSFTPHIDGGDFVVVTNVENIQVTGGKETKKMYHHYSGYPGGLTSLRYEEVKDRDPKRIFEKAVLGMLPKNKLQQNRMNRLFLYIGEEHAHTIHITHE
ncbi:MAG: 50S ribosomal protein L13 [Candidatus Moraniibacteriota bacterium]|nr:MAG: 50S ribosomal protein L13 [Candidatus Moranbacteria bacterium]